MKTLPLLSALRRAALLLATAASFGGISSAHGGILWGTKQASETELTILIDSDSSKVYMQVSGPSTKWFAWGFGQTYMAGYAIILNSGTGTGDYWESTMSAFVQPSPQAQQNLTATYTVASGTITYTISRALQTPDSADYKDWTTGNNNIIWAVGTKPFNMHYDRNAETITIVDAPKPKISGVQHNHAVGSTTLTLENLNTSLTNKIEFVTSLGTTNWITVSNLIFSPTTDANLAHYLTNLTVSISSGDTNAAGFYRIRQ